MEIKNNDIKDDILEFPDNFEELVNLQLLNLEKYNKIDLNKLLKIGIEQEENHINGNDKIENISSEKEDDWKDFESDDEGENSHNKYQRFEDDEFLEKEEDKKIINENNNDNNKEKNIENNEQNFSNININKSKEQEIDKNTGKNDIEQQNFSKEKYILKNKKLTNEQMKKMISKIDYTPPNWARNMNDKEFINKVKLYINKNKNI